MNQLKYSIGNVYQYSLSTDIHILKMNFLSTIELMNQIVSRRFAKQFTNIQGPSG